MNRRYEIGRIVFAILFLLGAIANSLILLANPNIYSGFADLSILTFYHQAWLKFVIPNLSIFISLVVMLELAFGLLLIGKGISVRMGLLLAALFMLFLVPFWWSGGALLNLAFSLILLWLSRAHYPVSVFQMLKQRAMDEEM
jgi:hypothetical protein